MLNIDQLKHDHGTIFLKLFKNLEITREDGFIIDYKRHKRVCFKYYKSTQNFYIRKREYSIIAREFLIYGSKITKPKDEFIKNIIGKHLNLRINSIAIMFEL